MAFMDLLCPLFFPALRGVVALIHILWKHHGGVAAIRIFLMATLYLLSRLLHPLVGRQEAPSNGKSGYGIS